MSRESNIIQNKLGTEFDKSFPVIFYAVSRKSEIISSVIGQSEIVNAVSSQLGRIDYFKNVMQLWSK